MSMNTSAPKHGRIAKLARAHRRSGTKTLKLQQADKIISVPEIFELEDLSPQDRRVQVAAARLRVTLDKRLNRDTPPDVKAIAKQEL